MKLVFAVILSLVMLPFGVLASDSTKAELKDAVQKEVETYEKFIKDIRDFEASDKFKPALLTESQPMDMDLGDPKAPVKIVEYASLSCIHCKEFHSSVFFQLKKNYIDTGKVYFKYRSYPLNAPAAKAASVLSCIPKDNQLAYIGALFQSQSQWAYTKSESDLKDKLRTVSKLSGLDDTQFEACYNDKAKEGEILAGMKRAYDDLMINSTPALFVQGKRFLEGREYETLAKYLDDVIAGKNPEKEAAKAAEPKLPEASKEQAKEPAKTDK